MEFIQAATTLRDPLADPSARQVARASMCAWGRRFALRHLERTAPSLDAATREDLAQEVALKVPDQAARCTSTERRGAQAFLARYVRWRLVDALRAHARRDPVEAPAAPDETPDEAAVAPLSAPAPTLDLRDHLRTHHLAPLLRRLGPAAAQARTTPPGPTRLRLRRLIPGRERTRAKVVEYVVAVDVLGTRPGQLARELREHRDITYQRLREGRVTAFFGALQALSDPDAGPRSPLRRALLADYVTHHPLADDHGPLVAPWRTLASTLGGAIP